MNGKNKIQQKKHKKGKKHGRAKATKCNAEQK